MESEDKRINQLGQISNAPANGVLPIDVPGGTETNGITVENLARTMPVATEMSCGIMEPSKVILLNSMSITYGVSGGEPTEFIRLGRFHKDNYSPIRITLSCGFWYSTTRDNIDLTITNYGTDVVCSGKGNGLIGYVLDSGNIFFKCNAGYSIVGTVIGAFVEGREVSGIEPEGIVYVE